MLLTLGSLSMLVLLAFGHWLKSRYSPPLGWMSPAWLAQHRGLRTSYR